MPEYDYTLKKEDFNLDFFTVKRSVKNNEIKRYEPKKEVQDEKSISTIAKSTSLHTAKKYAKKIPIIEHKSEYNGDEDDSGLMDDEDDEDDEKEIPGSNSEAEKIALEKYENQKKIDEAQEEFDRKDFNGEILLEKDSREQNEVKSIDDASLKIIDSLKSSKTKDIKIDDYLKVIISTFDFLDYESRAQILCYIIYGKLFSYLMYEGNQKVEKECKKIAKNVNFVKIVSSNKGKLNEEIFDLVKKYSSTVSIKGTSLSIFNKIASVIPKLSFGFYVENLENLDSDLVIPIESRNFLTDVGYHNSFKTEVICKFLVGVQKIAFQTKADEKKSKLLIEEERKKKAIREVNTEVLRNEYNDYDEYQDKY